MDIPITPPAAYPTAVTGRVDDVHVHLGNGANCQVSLYDAGVVLDSHSPSGAVARPPALLSMPIRFPIPVDVYNNWTDDTTFAKGVLTAAGYTPSS